MERPEVDQEVDQYDDFRNKKIKKKKVKPQEVLPPAVATVQQYSQYPLSTKNYPPPVLPFYQMPPLYDYSFVDNEIEYVKQILLGTTPFTIFQGYKANYPNYNTDLVELLISTVEQNKNVCESNKDWERPDHEKTLQNMKCTFSHTYKIAPKTKLELTKNSELVKTYVNQGVNGQIYIHPFDDSQIVTKVTKRFDSSVIQELVICFCILNTFLEQYPDAPLVPTYGFFLCSKDKNSNQQYCISDKPMDGIPHIFIVQKFMEDTITFRTWIKNGAILSDIIVKVNEIVEFLSFLQESEFDIYHSDLHGENILIKPDGSRFWIIDWGNACFTSNGKRFIGNIERNLYREDHDPKISSGAIDIYFLLNDIRNNSPIAEVKLWAYTFRSFLFNDSFYSLPDRFIQPEDEFYIGLPFSNCNYLYNGLWNTERRADRFRVETHAKNIVVLNKFRYQFIKTKLKEFEDSKREEEKLGTFKKTQNRYKRPPRTFQNNSVTSKTAKKTRKSNKKSKKM